MRKFSILFFVFLLSISIRAQTPKEKKVTSKPDKVTVFLQGAQITRNKTVSVAKGETILKFINLSPFVDNKSIQVKADGNVMILNVNFQHNYLKTNKLPKVLIDLQAQFDALQAKIDVEKANLEVISSEISFLNNNKEVGGKSQNLTVSALKSVEEYYAQKLKSLKLREITVNKKLLKLHKEQDKIFNEYEKNSNKKRFPTGEIWVKVAADNPTTARFVLTYNVKNAGWFPSYDIRADKLNAPLHIVYKANVQQDTKVDWKNVKLTFSSSNPKNSGELPKLKPYKLSYYSKPPVYKMKNNEVAGTVTEASTGDPLPGVNVMVKGTSIGTVTDFDGHYSIMIPEMEEPVLVFSYIGYKEVSEYVNSNRIINVSLEESGEVLDNVTISALGYKSKKSKSLQLAGKVNGVQIRSARSLKKTSRNKAKKVLEEALASIEIPIQRVDNQINISFRIKKPYTIQSNNQVVTVPMQTMRVPVNYEYISVPKVSPNAYLVSNITGWEKYNFLSGQANVFFENTSIGKTLLDPGIASDTLQVSLGVDKGISVKREKGKEFTGKKFIGTKKTDKLEWIITVKNNKNQPVDITVLDQVPVSITDEIEVEVTEKSGGKLNKETGEVKWNLHLAPGQKKVLKLRYEVKYSRYRTLILD